MGCHTATTERRISQPHYKSVRLRPGGVEIPPGLLLSFQRFMRPASGWVMRAPSSLGALPVAIADSHELLLPVATDEAFWIGLEVARPALRIGVAVVVVTTEGQMVDAITGLVADLSRLRTAIAPNDGRIAGLPRIPEGYRVITRVQLGDDAAACGSINVQCARGNQRFLKGSESTIVTLRLLDYATYADRSGAAPPAPLDPDTGYRGWRLP
jgi:hypothetical protein